MFARVPFLDNCKPKDSHCGSILSLFERGIGNDAESTAAQGEESDQTSPANKPHDPIIRSLSGDLHISQREVLLKGGSAKPHAHQVTHATMCPITTDEPARVYPR